MLYFGTDCPNFKPRLSSDSSGQKPGYDWLITEVKSHPYLSSRMTAYAGREIGKDQCDFAYPIPSRYTVLSGQAFSVGMTAWGRRSLPDTRRNSITSQERRDEGKMTPEESHVGSKWLTLKKNDSSGVEHSDIYYE